MRGLREGSVVRRSATIAAALAVSGWLSALTPGTTPDPREPQTEAAAQQGIRRGKAALVEPQSSPSPSASPVPTRSVTHRPAALPASPAPERRAGGIDCGEAKCVALTFDDGPMGSTSRLLDILADSDVKATFFLVGRNVHEFPDLVRREAAEGHELANHSYTHTDLGRSSSARVTSELRRTQEAIRHVTGVTPTLMRPPYGSTDGEVAAVTRRLKLAQVLWAVDPLDWKARDSDRVARAVVKQTRNGSIVLLHDIHSSTVKAVPLIIRRLEEKGYVFVTVSELFDEPLTPGKKYTER
ncbi:polysaccharide deacetylase family protein [Actinomadura viridis]|uniref:polysaccharide deacetylase family protein n=1 Tax=Actinomadura viridis TaxID=58110 RepID=UPI003686CF5F